MGTPEFGVPTLEHLAGSGLRMVGVYTQPDRPSGRGKKTRKSPVKVMAEAHGLPVFQRETLSTQDARAEMESLKPDVAVVAAYGLILPKWTLGLPTYGVLNVHPSLLPRHRGPAPVANAILEGDDKTGVTVMKVEPRVDSGPVLRSVSVEIGPRETTGALNERLAEIGARLLVETLRDWVRGLIEPIVQDEALATYSRKATRGDGEINWALPAVEIDRKIRANDPWPGSFTTWMGRRLKVLEAEPFEGGVGDPGMVMKGRGGVVVQTGRGQLALRKVQPEGSRGMGIGAFTLGRPEFIGTRLGMVSQADEEV